MNDENELLEPLATEAGQQAIVRAIRDISSLEYAVRAEQAASQASAKAGEASQSAIEASEAEDKAKDWATKTDTYVEQETITIPPEQEGEEPTTETINLYSARYYAALAQDIYNNMSFDSVPTENSTNMVSSGTVYSALDLKADKSNTYTKAEVDTAIGNVQSSLIFDNLPTQNSNNLVKSGGIYTALDTKADKSTTYTKTETDAQINTAVSNLVNSAPSTLDTLEELADALGDDPNFATTIATQLGNKADKSDTYTKTEVDTALSNVQSTLTFDNVPTANSDNPVKSSGIKTALDGKQDTLTFDSTPTANSTNPVTSGGVYTALQNVNIDIDDEITEDSDNPVTSAAIYEALQNFTPSGGGDIYNGDVFVSGTYIDTNNLIQNIYNRESSWDETAGIKVEYTATQDCFVCGYLANGTGNTVNKENYGINVYINDVFIQNITHTASNHSVAAPINLPLKKGDVFKVRMLDYSIKGYLNVFGIKLGDTVTREGMVEDVLFSNASGVNSGTINLSGNISDYDLIQFETNLKGYNNALNESSSTVLVSQLITLTDTTSMGKCLIVNSYDNTHIKVAYINDNTLSVVYDDKVYITKITGIKFGRYVSGVAVDTTVTQNSDAVVTSGAVYDALQNIPSGGGSSITVDSTITQGGTNPVEGGAIYTALAGKENSLTFDSAPTENSNNPVKSGGVYTALAAKGDVTTNTDQNITGTKTFVGSKNVAFKQSTTNDKLGFTLYGNTGTERGYLEFNPTNTIDGVTGLMTLGNYATSAAGLTQVGFRRYSNISGASGAYNLLMPMVADARTPFSLTTTYTNFYLPLGFKNGSTIVKADKSGVVDISSLLASLEARIAALEGN